MKNVNDEYIRKNVNGETAIKPYWYLRNGLLHIRYSVDRCIKLSPSEEAEIKRKLSERPSEKQSILEDKWDFLTECVGKEIINDGIAEIERKFIGRSK